VAEERYFFTITLTKAKIEQAMRIAPNPTDEAVLAMFTTAVELGLDMMEIAARERVERLMNTQIPLGGWDEANA